MTIANADAHPSVHQNAAPEHGQARMHIELAWSPAPRTVELLSLQLPVGSRVRDALQASGLAARVPEAAAGAAPLPRSQATPAEMDAALHQRASGHAAMPKPAGDVSPQSPEGSQADGRSWRGLSLAVFGRKLTLDSELFDGDRLDCCRPLRVDPKLARRERFNQQGSRRSGLFARRREGSVAGY